MRNFSFWTLLLLTTNVVFAQKMAKIPQTHDQFTSLNSDKIEFMKGKMIVCPAVFEDANTYVPMAPDVAAALKANNGRGIKNTQKSTFIVKYNGFSPDAKRAFQAAVDIWASIISSPVPIRINATWRRIASGSGEGTVLGQASPADFTRNFPGQQKYGTWYPIALAEKIAGQDLNSINEPDLEAEFNSGAPWYLGSGTPGTGQFDFTSVVLHELCHGLGFTSSMRIPVSSNGTIGTNGSWGFGTESPFVYDHFLENASSQLLINSTLFANPSVALGQQLIGNNLYFNSPTAIKSGEKPRIYAPVDYQPGSSISHLNDDNYSSGNVNSLMTSRASLREVIRDPGPLVRGMFADMGWAGTSFLHTRQKNIETTVSSVNVSATILSDTTIGVAKVYYTENDTLITNSKSIVMTRVGTSNVYSATIPITKTESIIRYYLTLDDPRGKLTSPTEAPTRGTYFFSVGTADKNSPSISATQLTFVPPASKPNIIANVEDSFVGGIDSVYLEYSVNGIAQKPFRLRKFNLATDSTYSQGRVDPIAYLAINPFPALKLNDRVLYRIVAIDKSNGKNKGALPSYMNTPGTNVVPTPDYYEFVVNELKTTTPASTINIDFNSNNDDFATIGGWGISQPSGFSNGALHSAHPYKNGGDEDLQSNTIALLRTPIKLKSNLDSAIISFDEVVLVEPGEDKAVFGDTEFYDYVVVEGSNDDGKSWIPFEAGYDSNADATWLKTFTASSTLVQGTFVASNGKVYQSVDSKALGTSSLFKNRTIKILRNERFKADDIILIRFRLFSDELTYGWGWAIDNLKIQVPPTPPVLATEPSENKTLNVFPVPSPDEVKIVTSLTKPGNVRMEVVNASGLKVMIREFTSDTTTFNQKLDVSDFANGNYLIRLITENGVTIKRFAVNK